jgi:hypothetical protein
MSTSGPTTNKDGHHPPLEPGVVEDAPCSARAWFSARKDISLTDNIFLSGIDKMVFGKIDTNIEPIDDSSFRDPDKLIESLGDAPSVPDVQMRDVSDVVMRGVDGVMMCVTDVIPWHQPGRHQLGVCAALMMSAPTGNFLWGAWLTRVPMKRRNAHLVYPGAAVHDRVPGIPGNLVLPRTPALVYPGLGRDEFPTLVYPGSDDVCMPALVYPGLGRDGFPTLVYPGSDDVCVTALNGAKRVALSALNDRVDLALWHAQQLEDRIMDMFLDQSARRISGVSTFTGDSYRGLDFWLNR